MFHFFSNFLSSSIEKPTWVGNAAALGAAVASSIAAASG